VRRSSLRNTEHGGEISVADRFGDVSKSPDPAPCELQQGGGIAGGDMATAYVGVIPNSLQDIGRASDGAKRRPVKAEGWAGDLILL
jgi:hypothetical protein